MIITSIEIENFRSYFGLQRFDLASDSERNTTFVWAANNVGKTNLLNAITWCFHEQFTASFKKQDDLLNHEAESDGKKSYSVTIVFIENEKTYSVRRGGGLSPGFKVHEILEDGDFKAINQESIFINSIIPKDMMKYFIIDGEGDAVTVDASGQISVERSIRDILGFQVAEKTLEDLNTIRKGISKELAKLDVGSELSKKQKEYNSIDDNVSRLEQECDDLEKALKLYTDDLDVAEGYLNASNHEVVKIKTKQRDDLTNRLKQSVRRLMSLKDHKIQLIRQYSWVAFSDELTSEGTDFIDENEFKGTIPAPFNETLVRDILQEASCICGAEISQGTPAYEKIHALLGKAADPDLMNRIGRARSQLQVIKSHAPNAKEDIKSNFDDIEAVLEVMKDIKYSIDAVSLEISDVDDVKIAQAESDRARLSKNIKATEKQIARKEYEIEGLKGSHSKLESEINRLSSMTPKANLYSKKIKFVADVSDVIKAELSSAVSGVKLLLVSKMNTFMEEHLRQHHKVKMTEDFKVGLYDTAGKLVAPGGGYTAILSLVYISTLIGISKMRSKAEGNILTAGAIAPLILDAPFSRLDPEYAPRLAAALPENSDQLMIIMFEGNARGGDKAIRDSGKLGREYYLQQHISGPKGNKKNSCLTVNGKEYSATEYDAEVNKVVIKEVFSNVG